MHSAPFEPNAPDEEALPPSWLEALRALPSEQGGPSGKTDAAIIAAAAETLAAIRRRRLRQRLWPALAAAACLTCAITLFSRPRITPVSQTIAAAEDKHALILREVSAVFPRQIKAIFPDGSDLQIELADQPLANSAQAVVIEVCERGERMTVITYIGQTVEIGRNRVTVNTDGNGRIVIDCPDFQSSGVSSTPGLQIKTRLI